MSTESPAVSRAHDEIARLCGAYNIWRMSIPANPARDSDLILSDALNELTAQRDRARATAVALDAELLALKELAAEMCSAYRGFLAQVIPEPLGHWARLDNSASALEQAVWSDRR